MNRLAIEILKLKELDDEFNKMVNIVNENKQNNNVNDIELLDIYGLYKQAINGDNIQEAPYKFQVKLYTKWVAWNKYKGLKKNEAKRKYIEYIKNILQKEI
jgi:diazepam-binding inhibitor (GABA receptor modulating acyl-CoA-binding protein)